MWFTSVSPDDGRISRGYETGSERVPLGDDLFIYADTQVHVRGWTHDVDLHIGVIQGRLACVKLVVTNLGEGTPITSAGLRELAVADLVRHAGDAVLHIRETADNGAMRVGTALPNESEAEFVAEHGFCDESLRIAARVYRVAYLIGDPPTKAVEQVLGLTRASAARWVSVARQRGYLGRTVPGKAGGVTAK